jgi:hypothetical protein
MKFLTLALLATIATQAHSQSQTIYVSPTGNDRSPGTRQSPVLTPARGIALARGRSNPVVQLAPGLYRLSAPIVLTPQDSGLTLAGSPNATLSGAVQLKHWKAVNTTLWSIDIPASIDTARQIYINGVRATRTKSRSPVFLTSTATGYTADKDTLAHYRHPADLEFVYTGGNALWGEPSTGLGSWTEPRCPVAAIAGTTIRMAEPCWTNSTQRVMLPNGGRSANLVGPASVGKEPTYLENAYEFLGRPGEFYIDRALHKLFYTPRPGEDLKQADIEVPALESLLEVKGTAAAPVQHVTFRNLTFSHTAWHDPSSPEGFSEIQANFRVTGKDGATKQALCTLVPGGTCPFAAWTPEPAAVTTAYADQLKFERNTFTHLGAAGLALTAGAHQNLIQGNVFTDISGNGLELAGVAAPMAPDPDYAIQNRIENNLFRNVGAEFRGGIPIVIGYARHTHVAHNQIDHVPYAGISIGWGGWPDKISLPGVANRSTGNIIEKNRITHFMLLLSDGGGIYTQGRTGEALADGERVQDNVVDEQFSSGHALYTDNGSAMITVSHNVTFNTNMDNWGSRHKDFYDGAKGDDNDPLAIEDNYWQQGDPDSAAKQVTEHGNHLIDSLADVPQDLLDGAGLEQPYRDLLNATNTPARAPEPPSSAACFLSGGSAYVSWRPPVDEGSAPVDFYTVYPATGPAIQVSVSDFNRLAYAKLAAQNTCAITITAHNKYHESTPSLPPFPHQEAQNSVIPGPPQSVTVRVENTRASIHIGAPKDHAEHVIAYEITLEPSHKTVVMTGRRLITLEGRHVTFVTLNLKNFGHVQRFGVAAISPEGRGPLVWSDAPKPEDSSRKSQP